MENLHIKLLREFENTGLSSKRSISKFMESNFQRPTSVDHDEWYRQNSSAHLFLKDITKIGHLDISDSELAGIRFTSLNHKSRWFDEVDINARITIDGLAYLEKQRANDLVKRNSNLQTFAIYLTVLLTSITLIISLRNSNSEDQINKLQIRLSDQSDKIHELQIQLSQTIINSQADHLNKKHTSR